jgi:hypothetical protein
MGSLWRDIDPLWISEYRASVSAAGEGGPGILCHSPISIPSIACATLRHDVPLQLRKAARASERGQKMFANISQRGPPSRRLSCGAGRNPVRVRQLSHDIVTRMPMSQVPHSGTVHSFRHASKVPAGHRGFPSSCLPGHSITSFLYPIYPPSPP